MELSAIPIPAVAAAAAGNKRKALEDADEEILRAQSEVMAPLLKKARLAHKEYLKLPDNRRAWIECVVNQFVGNASPDMDKHGPHHGIGPIRAFLVDALFHSGFHIPSIGFKYSVSNTARHSVRSPTDTGVIHTLNLNYFDAMEIAFSFADRFGVGMFLKRGDRPLFAGVPMDGPPFEKDHVTCKDAHALLGAFKCECFGLREMDAVLTILRSHPTYHLPALMFETALLQRTRFIDKKSLCVLTAHRYATDYEMSRTNTVEPMEYVNTEDKSDAAKIMRRENFHNQLDVAFKLFCISHNHPFYANRPSYTKPKRVPYNPYSRTSLYGEEVGPSSDEEEEEDK